jgi:hypothetical protein
MAILAREVVEDFSYRPELPSLPLLPDLMLSG